MLGLDTANTKKKLKSAQITSLANYGSNVSPYAIELACSGSGREATRIVVPALEKLDHILNQKLITREDVIQIVLNVRYGYLSDAHNIVLSNFNSTCNCTQLSETVWLQELKDICDYTVDVAEKFIARRDRLRNVWLVFCSFEQHLMEMTLMQQMKVSILSLEMHITK
ncbi:unnamed protein product [Sphenostylis stenocarpa]|uniref:Uncharacterized protein n=1 Tax=Sphenostylis stenocarpa TaxID=92480 RepID=A0AA86W1D9_9FABA|nr:unnamed protein product [Sphenostylis stenocarpa]